MNKLKDLIGSILKENYKNFDKKTDETNADIGALGKTGTTNLIEKIRTELSKLRQFIGYDIIDTTNGETGNYTLKETNYDSVFGYVGNSEDGKVKTLLDYIKIFVSDKTDQNNAIKSLQNTLATINSKLTQLDNDLEECAKSADLSNYVKSTTLGDYNTKDEIKNTYATKTEMTNYMANYAEATTVFNLKKDLEDKYVKKVDLPSDSITVTANNFIVSRDTDNNIKIDLADTNLFPGYKIYLSDNIGDLGKTQPGGNNGWLLQNSSDEKSIYVTLIKNSKITRFVFFFLMINYGHYKKSLKLLFQAFILIKTYN